MNAKVLTKTNCLVRLGFRNVEIGLFNKLIEIKQLTTSANNGKVPVHKNQKQVILKNNNHPSFEIKLKSSEYLKIKNI